MERNQNKVEDEMTQVVVDECLYSEKFMKKLRKAIKDHQFVFLGRGKLDIDIERYLIANRDSVLITADQEFDTHFHWSKSIMLEQNDPVKDKIRVIKAWLSK